MSRVLTESWFKRETEVVARELLGKYLVRRTTDGDLALPITETEAYLGPHDLACHAAKGRTARTEVMFGPPGHWYVYLIYGMYNMLNIVTMETGHAAAVLIRGAGEYHGPGKLTKALGVTRELNSRKATLQSTLWIEDRGIVVPQEEIEVTSRIGVEYAKEWATKPLRYVWNRG